MKTVEPKFPRPPGARAKKTRDPSKGKIRNGYFKSFDGTRIFYSVEGEGPPLVFCYGLVCSSLHWTYQIDHFRKNYQTIWMDYRAHQNSETPKNLDTLSAENFAADVVLMLDELEIDSAVFLGHSMGVNVILELFNQAPERIKAMVLSNGTPRRPMETMLHANIPQAGLRTLRRLYNLSPRLVQTFWGLQKGSWIAQMIIRLGGFNPYLTDPKDIGMYVDQVADLGPEVFIRLIEAYEKCDETSWLHKINVPVLLIAGERDHMTPIEIQHLMHQLIPDSQLEIVKNGSHCPQMDLPELINEKIGNFLGKMNYGATTKSK